VKLLYFKSKAGGSDQSLINEILKQVKEREEL
jgi:hypothetical protein